MPRRTLIDVFGDLASLPGEFLTFDDGYRSWTFTYGEMAAAARAFAARLDADGIAPGQSVAIWAENRPEWIVALWGCILRGAVLVPVDYRASPSLVTRIADIVDARLIITGEAVDAAALDAARPIRPVTDLRPRPDDATAGETIRDASPDDTVEIIFTSGATADPKGVVITHRNILANTVPIEREVTKYRRYIRPFSPIRFLNLLPLSHMFGQAMATFVPPMLPGTVLFTRSYAPEDVVRQVHDRRISVLVCVPKILEVLRDHVLRVFPEAAEPPPAGMHWARRWWRYRRIHRAFGLKFWAFVVGAAPLDPELEGFWGRLGFVVVQGYGLTETAPIVTLNHPLRAAKGAVGKPIAGVELKIAEDGEILVRGENVTRGYYNAPEETRAAFRDGWFHTGDIGELDERGQLHIRGRKKEMIVTPEGLNVFPEDVERALLAQPGVKDAAVVGSSAAGAGERVHAIVQLEPGGDLDAAVRGANATLDDHQRIRGAVAWPSGDLPRTEGTRKLKRRELRQWLHGQQAPSTSGGAQTRSVTAVLQRFAPGRTVTPDTTIEELGLSSLERVELMMALEETFEVTVDEGRFAAARTVADLDALTTPIEGVAAPAARVDASDPIAFPAWSRTLPARAIRRASLPTWILPLARVFARVETRGLEHLEHLQGPVIFAANHQSHFDTPVVLDALPPRWRYRVAPAMAKEFFTAHFHPETATPGARFTNSLNYYLASLFFNAFPLPQRETGTRQTLRYIGELVGSGFSVLIFPEGKRTQDGSIGRFLPGTAMIAARLGIPVVPVRLTGVDRILHATWRFPARGRAQVAFGAPLRLEGTDYQKLAGTIEAAVRAL